MSFTLVKGTFHVVGFSPDGDSVRFEADNAKNWDKITGRHKVKLANGRVQLRFEGVDALETHFQPKVRGAKNVGQPHGQDARDFTLTALGFQDVQWGPMGKKVVSVKKDGLPGFILTRDADVFGRPISFVYAGNTAKADGSNMTLDAAQLRKSVNYKLVREGMAYPTYYLTLFSDFRNAFTAAVKKARPQKGLWKFDKTPDFVCTGIPSITQANPILPKLFRRLVEHLDGGGKARDFIEFLRKKADGVLILPQAHHTSALDTVVWVKGNRIGMNVRPENLVFDPK